jgi:hypothetical protein
LQIKGAGGLFKGQIVSDGLVLYCVAIYFGHQVALSGSAGLSEAQIPQCRATQNNLSQRREDRKFSLISVAVSDR